MQGIPISHYSVRSVYCHKTDKYTYLFSARLTGKSSYDPLATFDTIVDGSWIEFHNGNRKGSIGRVYRSKEPRSIQKIEIQFDDNTFIKCSLGFLEQSKCLVYPPDSFKGPIKKYKRTGTPAVPLRICTTDAFKNVIFSGDYITLMSANNHHSVWVADSFTTTGVVRAISIQNNKRENLGKNSCFIKLEISENDKFALKMAGNVLNNMEFKLSVKLKEDV